MAVVGRAALGLPPLLDPQADGRQVAGDFRARRGDPVLQAGPQGVQPLVELRRIQVVPGGAGGTAIIDGTPNVVVRNRRRKASTESSSSGS